MKGKKYFYILLLTLAFTWLGGYRAEAQTVPPPPDTHGATDNQASGGGAPIGGGMFILLGLGAAYGGKKLYDMKEGR